jgi:phenylalanyl-tRNA synthetase beta subunit
MDVEEVLQTIGIDNIFNKVIAENSSNFEKEMPIQVQEASRTPNRHDQNRKFQWHIIIKTTSKENKERILKAVRENNQI